jgi:hypothetical protein
MVRVAVGLTGGALVGVKGTAVAVAVKVAEGSASPLQLANISEEIKKITKRRRSMILPLKK